jgi:prepilin-type N-terminal cleavage/methylation domain-containing protein
MTIFNSLSLSLKRRRQAFTLIELLVVIAIIAIVASLATIGFSSMRSKGRDTKRIGDVRQLQFALEMYKNDNGVYPVAITSGNTLVGTDGTTYMAKVPTSPNKVDGSCTDDSYTYTRDSNDASYHFTYCLGGAVNNVTAGNCTAVPGNVCVPATVAVATAPSVPLSFNLTCDSFQHNLISWTTPASDGGSAITGYKVYRGTTSGGETLLDTLASNYSNNQYNCTGGTTSYLYITAINAIGESSHTTEMSCSCQAYCFLADTKVTMADGNYKNIQDVKVGDMVLSYDSVTQKNVPEKVTKIFEHGREAIDHYLVINDSIKVTENHPFYLNGSYQPIGLAKLGDRLLNSNGETVTITKIERINEPAPTYNLEVENTHNYYTNDILVHNKVG